MNFLALLDSGTDISILPKSVADFLGVEYSEENKTCFYGFGKEAFECVSGYLDVIFLGGEAREAITIRRVPVLIPLEGDEKEPVLGCAGIFDSLRITFVGGQKIQITGLTRRSW